MATRVKKKASTWTPRVGCLSALYTGCAAAGIDRGQSDTRIVPLTLLRYEPESTRIAQGIRVKPLLSFVRVGVALLSLLFAASLQAANFAERYPQVRGFFPQADRFGELEVDPPSAAIQRGTQLLGYAFLTADVVQIPAYSGRPINTLVAFDVAGRLGGIQSVQHEEPILVVG